MRNFARAGVGIATPPTIMRAMVAGLLVVEFLLGGDGGRRSL